MAVGLCLFRKRPCPCAILCLASSQRYQAQYLFTPSFKICTISSPGPPSLDGYTANLRAASAGAHMSWQTLAGHNNTHKHRAH